MNTESTDHAPSSPIVCVDTRVPTFTLNRTAAAIRLGLATGALALATTPALAQQASTDDSESDVTTLQSITVQGKSETVEQYAGEQVATGGRMGFLGDRDFMETPFSAISYTEKYIADQQAHDIIEVIAKTDPSVFSSRIAGESQESYSIRGLDSSVSDVTINGLAGMAAYYRNSPEMYERIEVHKGPSALLNGMPPKGSAGGTVNLVTKRAGEDPLTRLTGTFSSESHTGGHVDIGRRFGESNQFGVRFNSVYRDGEMAVEGQEKRVTMNSLGLDWRGERTRLSADLYQSKDQANGLTRGLTLAPGVDLPSPPDPDVTWNPPWAFYESTDKGAMVRGEFDLTDNLTTYATVGTSKTELDTNMGVGQLYNDAGDFTINFSGVADRMRRKSAEIGLQGNAETGAVGHQFAINATYYNEDYRLNGFRNLLPVAWQTNIYNPVWGPAPELPSDIMAITQTDTKLTSFGVADTLSFADERLQLTLGVRRQQVVTDSYNGTTGARLSKRYDEDATTPAVAVLFKATEQISLYANYIEGLSQGSIAPNTADNAGEVFAPYKTKQREVGVKFDLGSFAHTLSVYEIERPSSYTDPVTNVFSFGGEQRNRGVEWGFFGAPLDDVRLMGGIAYSEAEITKASTAANEGQQAVGLPEWQGKLGAEWDVPMLSGLTLTANATSVSEQYLNADNSLKIPGYTVFDLGARHSSNAWGHPLTLRAAVTNVGNKAYWAKPHYTSLALGAPRTATLSATVDF